MKASLLLTTSLLASLSWAQSPSGQSIPETSQARTRVSTDLKAVTKKVSSSSAAPQKGTARSVVSKIKSQALMAGPGEGGGGDVQRSTEADLREVVNSIGNHFWEISDQYLLGQELRISNIRLPAKLENLTRRILGTPLFSVSPRMVDHVRSQSFEIVNRPCYHDGEEKDSSTLKRLMAPICLSATRLSRFPKSTLKDAVIPLIFHEIAHQYGFDESDAKAFQDLAELHLKYRPVYLSALRARFQCAYASQSLTEMQKEDARRDLERKWPKMAFPNDSWPELAPEERTRMLMACVARAVSTGEHMNRMRNGSGWIPVSTDTLSAREKLVMTELGGRSEVYFHTLVRTLTDPSTTNFPEIYSKHKVDAAWLMMIGAKAALRNIAQDVVLQQDLISLLNP